MVGRTTFIFVALTLNRSFRSSQLVTDFLVAAEHARVVLDEIGIQADTCFCGAGALRMTEVQHTKQTPYNLVLMDRYVPEMDGLEAAAAIRALNRTDAKSIPMIVLTANAFGEDVQRSLQAGMNAHLSKPEYPDHFYQTLGELVYECEKGRKQQGAEMIEKRNILNCHIVSFP